MPINYLSAFEEFFHKSKSSLYVERGEASSASGKDGDLVQPGSSTKSNWSIYISIDIYIYIIYNYSNQLKS